MLPLVLNQVCFAVNGRLIIDRVSMAITEVPRTIILGPNGAGKSVLMRLCHGLLRPTSGSITWRGAVNGRRRQAMVFQRPVMLRRSALGNIEGVTRVMTTAIALETSKGDLPLALGLGIILITLVVALNAGAYWVKEAAQRLYG